LWLFPISWDEVMIKEIKEITAGLKDAVKCQTGGGTADGCGKTALSGGNDTEQLDGSSRRAERGFGRARATVEKAGLGELKTGVVCKDNYSARGNRRTKDKDPQLKAGVTKVAVNRSTLSRYITVFPSLFF
jgi:hypothetical protein